MDMRMIVCLLAGLMLVSCDPEPTRPAGDLMIGNPSVPKVIEAELGDAVKIGGEGFMIDDVLTFTGENFDGSTIEVGCPVVDAKADYASIQVVRGFVSDLDYIVELRRDGDVQILGETTVVIIGDNPPPGPEPSTEPNVSGGVYCNQKPVPDVYVTDGVAWAKTGSDGKYEFRSEKKYGLVFIVVPSGYEAESTSAFMDYWAPMTSTDPETKENISFALVKVDNDVHKMLLTADWHVANRLGDATRLDNTYGTEMAGINSVSTVPVYELALGDLTWDSFWYSSNFYINTWKNINRGRGHKMFPVIGNHDYDYKAKNSLDASIPFRKYLGPLTYSVNIGKVHYVIVNDILYNNPSGTVDGRNPQERVTEEDLEWIRTDLSHVDKSTPIVVATHSAVNKYIPSGNNWVMQSIVKNSEAFLGLFSEFEDVRIVAGHRHIQHYIDLKAEGKSYARNKMVEYTVPPVGGTLWTTQPLCGFDIGTDGCPPCYEFFDVDNTDFKWQFRSYGESDSFQMRCYDMNKVKYFWDTDAKVQSLKDANASYSFDMLFGTYEQNSVFINVFAGDPRMTNMKVEAFEDGKSLPVTVLAVYDPQHVASYDVLAYSESGSVNASFKSVVSSHIYKVVASNATSTVTVKLTDQYGKTYETAVERPKAFSSYTQY